MGVGTKTGGKCVQPPKKALEFDRWSTHGPSILPRIPHPLTRETDFASNNIRAEVVVVPLSIGFAMRRRRARASEILGKSESDTSSDFATAIDASIYYGVAIQKWVKECPFS